MVSNVVAMMNAQTIVLRPTPIPIPDTPTVLRDSESCAGHGQGSDEGERKGIQTSTTPGQTSQQLTSPSTSAITSATTMSEDPWDYSIPVPGSKKRKLIYPKAAIEMEPWTRDQWQQRFVVVKNQLETLVHRHLRLLDFASRPTYSSRMVGTCSSDARPSVVVICRDVDFKSIQHLFRTRAQEHLHLGKKREAAISLLFLLGSRGGGQEESKSTVPRLQLVYYQTRTSPMIWSALEDPVHVQLGDSGATCGGIVRYRDNMATLGVAVDFRGAPAFLTVGHLFKDRKTDSNLSCLSGYDDLVNPEDPNNQISTDLGCDNPNSSLWDDDDEYEALDTNNEPGQIDGEFLGETETKGNDQDLEMWEWVADSAELDASHPYLDWALVRPSSKTIGTPTSLINTVFPDGGRVVLTGYERSPASHLAAIYVVSGLRGILYGQIIAAITFLPSLPGQRSGAAWTVILDSKEGIQSGECGSVVVDRATNKIYGHVVGRDPIGYAYVVPLANTLDQISVSYRLRFIEESVKRIPPLFSTETDAVQALQEAASISGADPVSDDAIPPPLLSMVSLGHLSYQDAEQTPIEADIHGIIDNGFFFTDDGWTCYRRTYFSCICSYAISRPPPWTANAVVQFVRGADQQHFQVYGFAMCISAVDMDDLPVELVQNGPKKKGAPRWKRLEKVRLASKTPQIFQDAADKSTGGKMTSQTNMSDEHRFDRIRFKREPGNGANKSGSMQQYYRLAVELWADVGSQHADQFIKVAYRPWVRVNVCSGSLGDFQFQSGPGDSASSARYEPTLKEISPIPIQHQSTKMSTKAKGSD